MNPSDRWTRDEAEENKIRRYIENNPVRARLVARAEDGPWSSAKSVTAAQAGVPVLPATLVPALGISSGNRRFLGLVVAFALEVERAPVRQT